MARAQTIIPLVLEGDVVPSVGNVVSIDWVRVIDDGSWLVQVETDAPFGTNHVLLRDGEVALVEGDPIDGPPDIMIDTFGPTSWNERGQIGFGFFLEGAGAPLSMNRSVHAYLDTALSIAEGTVLVVQEGDPVPNLTPGTVLNDVLNVKINEAEQLLVTGTVDDPKIGSIVDYALYLWTTDASRGGIVSSTLIAFEGDVLPGQTTGLTRFDFGPYVSAINASGDVVFAVAIPTGDAIYRWSGGRFTELAQEGDPAPVPGRSWSNLLPATISMNNAGDIAIRGDLAGDQATNELLVKNGVKLIQEGDTLPAIGNTFTFTSFRFGPAEIDDLGRVLWFGRWNNPDPTRDTGLFLDHRLVIEEGVTTVDGLGPLGQIGGVLPLTLFYDLSDNGRWLIFKALYGDGSEGAFLVEVGPFFADGFASGDTSAWSLTMP